MVERLRAVSFTLGIQGSFQKKLRLFSLQIYLYADRQTYTEGSEWLFTVLGEENERGLENTPGNTGTYIREGAINMLEILDFILGTMESH